MPDPGLDRQGTDFRSRTRSKTGWLILAFATLVVCAAVGCGTSGPEVGARTAPRQAESPGAPDGTDAGATQVVRYRNVEFTVPAGWPVHDLEADPSMCVRFDEHAVYLGHPGADMQCPATVNGHAAAVLVEPLEGAMVASVPSSGGDASDENGLAVESDPAAPVERQLRSAFPTVGLAVTVTFEDSDAPAHEMLQSFRAVTP